MSDMLATIILQGLPIVRGGVTGFAIGFFLKKLLKFIILVIGFVFALIAFPQYKKWIAVDWATVQNQTGGFFQHLSQQVLNAVDNAAQTLDHHNLNHLARVTGFVPGFFLDVIRG